MHPNTTKEKGVIAAKKRLQFDFTEEAIEEIDELQQLTQLPTRVETIRYALRFLRWAVDETRNGGTLCIERSGKIREVIPFWQSTNSRTANNQVARTHSMNGK